MNIAVCVSQVPDTASKIKISADGKNIDTAGLTYIINPYDEYAIEEALRIKERNGATVYILCIGDDTCTEIIRKALAMGADEGILIKGEADADSMKTAKSLAAGIKQLNCELVFMGKQSIDFDNGVVPQITAELLDYNCVNVCVKLELNGNEIKAEREIEGGKEIVQTSLPAVISAQKGLNEPRYASLKGIMAAKKKSIQIISTGEVHPCTSTIALSTPAAKAAGRILGSDASAVQELVKLLHEEAKVI